MSRVCCNYVPTTVRTVIAILRKLIWPPWVFSIKTPRHSKAYNINIDGAATKRRYLHSIFIKVFHNKLHRLQTTTELCLELLGSWFISQQKNNEQYGRSMNKIWNAWVTIICDILTPKRRKRIRERDWEGHRCRIWKYTGTNK